jgi:hypothetical protein
VRVIEVEEMRNIFDICERNGLSTLEDSTTLNSGVVLVGSDADLDGGYAALGECFGGKQIILDLETQCPSDQHYALSPYDGDIRLMQISGLNQSKVLVIDFKTPQMRSQQSPSYLAFLDVVVQKIRDFASNKGIPIGHNLGFDLAFLRVKFGIQFWHAYDTQILSQMLYAGILTYRHSLKACVERELGMAVDKSEQMSDWSKPLTNSQLNYAAQDITVTKMLFRTLAAKVKIEGLSMVAKIEAEFLPALVEINHYGLPVDVVELESQIAWYQKKLLDLEIEFLDSVGYSKIRSNKHIANIVAKLEALKSEEDDESEDDEREEETVKKIEKLKASGATKADLAMLQDHRVVQVISIYRTLSIYLKYCEKVRQEMREVEGVTRASGSVRQLTRKGNGRTSSGNSRNPKGLQGVNLQNPPNPGNMPKIVKKLGCPIVREIFKPPALFTLKANTPKFELTFYQKNHPFFLLCWLYSFRFFDSDLSGAHGVIAAFYAGETNLVDALVNKLDIHSLTMQGLFQVATEYIAYKHLSAREITKINKDKKHKLHKVFSGLRKMCKNVFYGGINRQSAPTLQNTVKANENIEIPIEDCEKMVKAFPIAFPNIAKLHKELETKSNRLSQFDGHLYGVFQTDFGFQKTEGYKRRVYSFCKYNKQGKPYTPLGDCANVWLATESDVMKTAIARIYREAVINGEDLKLGLICHDEILAWGVNHKSWTYAKIIRDAMYESMLKFTGNGYLPLPAMNVPEVTLIGDDWSH